jgi:hypothetical protein
MPQHRWLGTGFSSWRLSDSISVISCEIHDELALEQVSLKVSLVLPF